MLQEIVSKRFKELPMLEFLLSNLMQNVQEKFITFLKVPIHCMNEAVLPMKAFDYPQPNYQNVIAIEYNFLNWNLDSFLIFLDRSFLYKVIEITLGGQNLDYSLEVQNRDFSKIEERIIEKIVHLITDALNEVLMPILTHTKLLQKNLFIQNYMPTVKGGEIFLSRTSINIKDLVSVIDLVIPYDSILPIKNTLIKGYSNQEKIQSKVWENHMSQVIKNSSLQLAVELIVTSQTNLLDLQDLQIGTTLMTNKSAQDILNIKIQGEELLKGKLGSINNKMAIEVV